MTAVPTYIDDTSFYADVAYIESLFRRQRVGMLDMPVIDRGSGGQWPVVFVPILEHLEFVYARQIRELIPSQRVILYRRHETRSRTFKIRLVERAEELRAVLDSLNIAEANFVAHGDAAMVLFEFATRYPQRCHSLIIIAQGADYEIAPHPFIWMLHEAFVRLPVERFLPAWFLRRTVVNYIMAPRKETHKPAPSLPRHLIDEQFQKIQIWPSVYKFSVLPVIHYYDMRDRLDKLTMPILLINRLDDALSPAYKTRWLAEHLPNCAGYYLVPGGERFFMYSQAEAVTPIIQKFLGKEQPV